MNSEFDRGYEQGFRAAILTADLTRCGDENTKKEILKALGDGLAVIVEQMSEAAYD